MKTNHTRTIFIAALAILTLVALPLCSLCAQAAQNSDGWSPYRTWEPQHDTYNNYNENKAFDTGFGAYQGRLLTAAEMDEARAHTGTQYNIPQDSWGYTAHVNIPLN